MEKVSIKLIAAIFLSLISQTIYGKECEKRDKLVESIDSAIIYMPTKDGIFTLYEFPGCTKDRLVADITAYNISPRKCNRNNYPEILNSIVQFINTSIEIDTLSYNASEILKHTPTDLPINKMLPGSYWSLDYQDLKALVILYMQDEIELMWIAPNYVEYKNFRVKCDIFNMLDKSAI